MSTFWTLTCARAVCLTGVVAAMLCTPAVQAANTLAKIQASGSVTMGVRESSRPLSYAVAPGQYTGYHVELCTRVLADVQQALGLARLAIQHRAVDSQSRIPMMLNGVLDLECGSTTNSLPRQRDVAFAITTYVEEVRIATRVGSGITGIAQLAGQRVATTAGTTAVQLLRQHERAAGVNFREVFGKDHIDSFRLLATGRADAFVMDSALLAGLISGTPNPADFHLVGEVLSVEPIAIMLPKGDAAFKQVVDDSLAAMMKSGAIQALYERWFNQPIPPDQRSVGLPLAPSTRAAWAEPNDRPVESYRTK